MDIDKIFPIELDAIVLECKDAAALSDFYIRLLGWRKNYTEPGEWTDIVSPTNSVKIAFQQNEKYLPPVWPDEPNAQQQMAHLDFIVKDHLQLELAVNHALSCGATKATAQFAPGKWITMIDPAGHPFDFVIW